MHSLYPPLYRETSLEKMSTNINPPKSVDIARKLPCSKNSTGRSVHNLDDLWTNLPWEKHAPFFCRQLLYVLEDEIWRAICGGDHFLKCMFSTWKTNNKSIFHFTHDIFLKCFQTVIFDTWYVTLTWKSDGSPDILISAAAQKTTIHLWKLILPYWNTGSVAGKSWAPDYLAK